MNVIEALKTGRRVRRKGWADRNVWLDPGYYISREECLADDWEVEPQPVTINRHKFNEAWDKAMDIKTNYISLHEALVKELGL